MNIKKRFGLTVRRLREKQGWSQEKLAEITGLHRTYISGIERGTRNPTIMIVEQIANALKVPIADLFGKADE